MIKAKNNPKTDNITLKNIYKEDMQDIKIKEILLKSYKIFIYQELKEGGKCLNF